MCHITHINYTGDAAAAALEAVVAHAPSKERVVGAFLPLLSHRHPTQRAKAAGVVLRCCGSLRREGMERVREAAGRLLTVGGVCDCMCM